MREIRNSVHADPTLVHEYPKFLELNVCAGAGVALADGYSLADIRAARRHAINSHRNKKRTVVLPGYDDFLITMEKSRYQLLEDLPVSFTEKKHPLFSVPEISVIDPSGKTPPIILIGSNAMWLKIRAIDYLASEFADDLAIVLGDTASVRFFAYRVLRAANEFRKEAKVRPERLLTASDVRAQLEAISDSATDLAELLRAGKEARSRIDGAHDELWHANMKRKVLVDGAIQKIEPESAYSIRREAIDWLPVRHLLETIARDANHAAGKLNGSTRQRNERHKYTHLSLIADAWMASIQKRPSASPKSAFSKVVQYCHFLFSPEHVEVRTGLKYWEETRGKVSQRDRMRGVNPLLV